MKNKVYFCYQIDEERCYTLDYFLEEMKDREIKELELFEAKRVLETDYFYCKAIGEVCIKQPEGEPCGNECQDYEPRNKIKGCCKYRGYCYEPDEEKTFILKLDGKLYSKND